MLEKRQSRLEKNWKSAVYRRLINAYPRIQSIKVKFKEKKEEVKQRVEKQKTEIKERINREKNL